MDTQSNVRDLNDHRDDTVSYAVDHLPRAVPRTKAASAKPIAAAAFGSGWYHDAAIEASRREAIDARCHPVHW